MFNGVQEFSAYLQQH